jgi:aldose 1-epimerase
LSSVPALLRAGDFEAVIVPEDGMLVAALRHRGEDYLAERADPWTGCPLLYPWANRLSADRFTVRGRTVDASGARRDENGVLLHGFPSSRRGWVVEHADDATVRARRTPSSSRPGRNRSPASSRWQPPSTRS